MVPNLAWSVSLSAKPVCLYSLKELLEVKRPPTPVPWPSRQRDRDAELHTIDLHIQVGSVPQKYSQEC